jgi:hypothetical protein
MLVSLQGRYFNLFPMAPANSTTTQGIHFEKSQVDSNGPLALEKGLGPRGWLKGSGWFKEVLNAILSQWFKSDMISTSIRTSINIHQWSIMNIHQSTSTCFFCRDSNSIWGCSWPKCVLNPMNYCTCHLGSLEYVQNLRASEIQKKLPHTSIPAGHQLDTTGRRAFWLRWLHLRWCFLGWKWIPPTANWMLDSSGLGGSGHPFHQLVQAMFKGEEVSKSLTLESPI